MPLTAGTKFGPYEIVGALGAGGMGEVYRAHDSRLARDVAIKVLTGETGRTVEGRKRFEVEARAASSLNHPNILTIYDFGQEGGQPYIVSELVAGESLRERLRRGALPLPNLLDLAVQSWWQSSTQSTSNVGLNPGFCRCLGALPAELPLPGQRRRGPRQWFGRRMAGAVCFPLS